MFIVTRIDCLRECNDFKAITVRLDTHRVVTNIWNNNYKKLGNGEFYISDYVVYVFDTYDNSTEKMSLSDFVNIVWDSYYKDLGIIEQFIGLSIHTYDDKTYRITYNKQKMDFFNIIISDTKTLASLLRVKMSLGIDVDLCTFNIKNLDPFLNVKTGVAKVPEGFMKLIISKLSKICLNSMTTLVLPDSMIYVTMPGFTDEEALKDIYVKNLSVFYMFPYINHELTIHCRENCKVPKSFFYSNGMDSHYKEKRVGGIYRVITPSNTVEFDFETCKAIRKKNI